MAELTPYEQKQLQAATKQYSEQGYDAKTAQAYAIQDVLESLKHERAEIIRQVKGDDGSPA